MMSLNLNKRCIDRLIVPATVDDNNDDNIDAHCNPRSRKARRLNTSTISCSPMRSFPTIITPPSLSLSSLLQQQGCPPVSAAINATFPVPVLSPATYLSMALQNQKHGTPGRIAAFSLEQALYFAPYTTGELSIELLRALRQSDLPQLRTLLVQQDQDQQDDPQENFNKKTSLFHQRNSFGENLLHLACRMGVPQTMVQFLVEEAHVPLNVRDRWGRSPLHNACLTGRPNFNTLVYLLHHPVAVPQVRMEEDTGKLPFELIPARCYARWTRFLAEQHILPRVAQQLASSSSSSSIPPQKTSSTKSPTTTMPIIRAAATNDAVTPPLRPVTIEDEEDENDEHDDADAFLAALMPLWPC